MRVRFCQKLFVNEPLVVIIANDSEGEPDRLPAQQEGGTVNILDLVVGGVNFNKSCPR